jgi:methylthioribose-1-phosphate isomerase
MLVRGAPLIGATAAYGVGRPVNILTHCNAGWLATVDWGTALAPIYLAHDAGIPSMSGSTRPGRATRAQR